MEKTVKVSIDIKIARTMLGLAGFHKIATTGTDDEVFDCVLSMMDCYGAKSKIVEDTVSPEAASLLTAMAVIASDKPPFSEFNDEVCNDGIAF